MANEDAGLAVVAYSFASSGAPGAKLKVRRVHVDESISEGYRAELEIVTEDEFFEPASLLGEGASLEIARASLLRSVFGVVYRVETLGQTASKRVYRVHFGPAMNSLRFRTNTRCPPLASSGAQSRGQSRGTARNTRASCTLQ